MRDFRKVLSLRHEAKLSFEKIAQATSLSKGVVVKYVEMAGKAGLTWPLPDDLDDAALEARLYPSKTQLINFVEPNFSDLCVALKHPGVTLALLWEEYSEANGLLAYRYSAFCDHYRAWNKKQHLVMRQSHKGGEKAFVDYSGVTVPVVDSERGTVRQAQIFVAVLGASSYTYAEASWTQSLPDWLSSHWRAYRFFGGVPEATVPDCLKSGVKKADRYEPTANETYQEMADCYGTVILPARPYHPRDKAKVEVGVQVVQRWILARLRQRTFFSLAELNVAIWELLDSFNRRRFRKMPDHSRRSLYEELDLPVLKNRPLPAKPYELVKRERATVPLDYHITVEKHQYSVPYTLVDEKVDVRISATLVEIYFDGKRVASHARSFRTDRKPITDPAHMPKSHRAHMEWTPGRFLNWAQGIGNHTRKVVQHLLNDRPHPEHGYRACLGLLSLSRKYSRARLEAACRLALEVHSPCYKSVRSILQMDVDKRQGSSLPAVEPYIIPEHRNLRGPEYYQ